MKHLNLNAISFGCDGRVELNDADLIEIERHFEVSAGATGTSNNTCRRTNNVTECTNTTVCSGYNEDICHNIDLCAGQNWSTCDKRQEQ